MIISVWGNAGSGKSMFSASLAKALTKSKKKAIILSNDSNTPMFPVWLPGQPVEASQSIGTLFSSMHIDAALTASKVVLLRSYPFIGLMGYCASDTPLSYPELEYAPVLQTIQTAASLVDYLIIDCNSHVKNLVVPAAIESSDITIQVLTPDLKGVSFLMAHTPVLKDEKFRLKEHIKLAGLARPYHAIEEMGHVIGGFDGLLPFNKEIDRSCISGEMFSALHVCGKKYQAALDKIIELIEVMGHE